MKTEQVIYNNILLGLIIYNQPSGEKVEFYTEDDNSLQVGKHIRTKGESIKPHIHLPVPISRTETLQEVLYIETGKLRISFYSDDGVKVDEKVLIKGDMALLMKGAHGFDFDEATVMIEVKQGPFNPASKKPLEIKE